VEEEDPNTKSGGPLEAILVILQRGKAFVRGLLDQQYDYY
jgi:hypothetical protein